MGVVVFPQLKTQTRSVFEPGTGSKSTSTHFTYDDYGNVATLHDTGDELTRRDSLDDDIFAAIEYQVCTEGTKYIVDKPKKIVVKDARETVKRREGVRSRIVACAIRW